MQDEESGAMNWLSDQAVDRLRAAADTPDLSGTDYVLLDKLGAGGMGGVYRVEDAALGRQVALKVLRIVDSSGEFSARLLREAKIIAQLEHPGIVPVHDVGTLPDGRVFYTMKLVQGRRLDQNHDELGGVPERLRIFQEICDAVSFAYAHNVLHRDLKPQNIMVGRFGEVLVIGVWPSCCMPKIPQERTRPRTFLWSNDSPPLRTRSQQMRRPKPNTEQCSELPATWRRSRLAARLRHWDRGRMSTRWEQCLDS
jgi:serine/threonine protein kinase